jgi:hypothetical protein
MKSHVDQLLERAKAATSLANFGDDSFREGLEILVSSADREARLTERGRQVFDAIIVDSLCQRLHIEYWYTKHPEIDEQEIVAPLIGLGLPRTGSTALGCMLAEDPAVRSIRNWESIAPCPPPEKATEHTDPRIARAAEVIARRREMSPRMKTMLPSSATSPTECQTFMGYDFKSQLFQATVFVPTYFEWLNYKADLEPTYHYVKRVLKLLQWRCPPTRWRLKNPSHICFIDKLVRVFPDARFWMTHRDVASVIPSLSDLYYEMIQALSDEVDKVAIGRMNTEWCEIGMRRVIAFRDAGNDHRFFDIQFADLQRDPVPILEQLYAFLGETLTPEARAGMERWRHETPREKHGEHTYDAADFGLDVQELRERFRFYTERFDVAVGNQPKKVQA